MLVLKASLNRECGSHPCNHCRCTSEVGHQLSHQLVDETTVHWSHCPVSHRSEMLFLVLPRRRVCLGRLVFLLSSYFMCIAGGLVIPLFQLRTDWICSKPEGVYPPQPLSVCTLAVNCPLWLQASEGRKNFTWKLASGLRCNGGPVILSSMNPTRTAGQSGCLVSLRSWAESQALPPFIFTLAAAACPPGAVSSNLSGVLRVCRKGAVLKFYMYFIKHYICHEEIHKKGSS